MMSAGTTRLEVVQVAAPAEAGVSVTVGQSLLDFPLILKVTVPDGVTGVIGVGPTCAVKVAAGNASTATEAGEPVTVSVAVTGVSFWVIVPGAAVVKLLSPE
jgi:hypothetical protein